MSRRQRLAVAFVAPLVACCGGASLAQESTPAYLDPAQPIDRRVDDLVSRMTLEEKASQLVNHTRAVPRLGVPEYNLWSEALHGVAANGIATVFPQAIGLAATFDAPLVHEMAQAIALEGRAKFNRAAKAGERGELFKGITFFSPNINIFRDPRWGRGQETYGEDPFLTGRLGVAFVTGLQGDDPKHLAAVATAKHFAVHSGPEPLRHGFDAKASAHDIEDTYLPAFRDAVVDGRVRAVMCVYNAVNGVPGCASSFLLTDTLRKAWGFSGFVTGDCDAVRDIYTGHKFAKSLADAAAIAVKAGTDNDCQVVFGPPGAAPEYQKYLDAVKEGSLSEGEIDVAVRRMMRTRFEQGLFDPPERVKPAQTPDSVVDSEEHRALAARIARSTMVLLKNGGVLPLAATTGRIAVVGPLADSGRVLLGNYNGTPSRSTTVLDGIRRQFPSAKVVFEPGTSFLRPLVPVPTTALRTDRGKPGLQAEVFAGPDLAGKALSTRVDPQVAYGLPPGTWPSRTNPPKPEKPTRWTGWLTPEASGPCTLAVEGFGNRLYLDGTLLVDTTAPGFPPKPHTADVVVEKGRRYAIRVEAVPRFFPSARLSWLPPDPAVADRAVAAAREADVVVAVVGITSDLEGEESGVDQPGFKGGDRTSLELPKGEQELLEAVEATGTPLVVVLMSGSPLAVSWANAHADAILQAWYPGEEGGTAVAETLAGVNNPAGRLPLTFYKGVDQLPEFTDYSMKSRTYRYFTGEPLYPFGYGLSYSTFAYSGLRLSRTVVAAGEPLDVEADVRNTSGRDGDEVVQAYLVFPKLPGAPNLALRGFTRVHLAAGERRRVHFTLGERELGHVNEAGTHLVSAGRYWVSVGGGQPGTSAPSVDATFSIIGEKELPR
ncbi:MAG TPA: glycoside hydrolase family 3 C-terminal domain-containing protein [Vicinamibacteria bacterium]|nr:glycoside hydrolase family 3 C-terminal domain-containing protein [Vicinamibacteria bacterium]